MQAEVSIQGMRTSCFHTAAICRIHEEGMACLTLVSSDYKILILANHYKPLFCIHCHSVAVSDAHCDYSRQWSAFCLPKASDTDHPSHTKFPVSGH